jgi:hypothetical protein
MTYDEVSSEWEEKRGVVESESESESERKLTVQRGY